MARTVARRDMEFTPEEWVRMRDTVKMVGVAQPAKKYTTRKRPAQRSAPIVNRTSGW